MLTEREKKMIEAYLPNPRDESLEPYDYYVEDGNGKIFKVHIRDIFCRMNGEDGLGVVTETGRRIENPFSKDGGFTMSQLYDNKKDCRNGTHFAYNRWENLRKKQREE